MDGDFDIRQEQMSSSEKEFEEFENALRSCMIAVGCRHPMSLVIIRQLKRLLRFLEISSSKRFLSPFQEGQKVIAAELL